LQTGKDRGLTFTLPTPKEKKRIIDSLQRYMRAEDVSSLLKEKHILILRGRRQEAYLLSDSLWSLYRSLKDWRHPYFIGLFLGEIRDEVLQPSLHVCHRLSVNPVKTATVIVTPQGEQKFLYGKDLEIDYLQTQPEGGIVDLEVLVLNQVGEALGYGVIKRVKEGGLKLKNRKDLGWYLRRGG
jgi:ribosome biogenesis protein Nip4